MEEYNNIEHLNNKKRTRCMNPIKTTLREDLGEEEIKKIKEIHREIESKHMGKELKYKEYVSKIEYYNSVNDKQVRLLSENRFKFFIENTEDIPKATPMLIKVIDEFTKTKKYNEWKKANRCMNPPRTTLREKFSKERLQEWDDLAKKADEVFKDFDFITNKWKKNEK